MHKLQIILLATVIWITHIQSTCYPKLTPQHHKSRRDYWIKTIEREKDQKTKALQEKALKELDTAIKKLEDAKGGKEEVDQDTCRTINRSSEFLERTAQASAPDRPLTPLERKLSDIPDTKFLEWAMASSMDGSVFSEQLGNEDFINRVLALSDGDFTKLMTELKIWHGGTPLMVIMNKLPIDIPQEAVEKSDAYRCLNKFWDHIKTLDEQKKQSILRADYLGMMLSDWLKQNKEIRQYLPEDLRKAIDALPPSPKKENA